MLQLLVKFSKEKKNLSREVNAIERNSESAKKDFISRDQSNALSAFTDKNIAISGFDKVQAVLHLAPENDTSDAAVSSYRIISKESVPEEIRTDSGIEILAESLKEYELFVYFCLYKKFLKIQGTKFFNYYICEF